MNCPLRHSAVLKWSRKKWLEITALSFAYKLYSHYQEFNSSSWFHIQQTRKLDLISGFGLCEEILSRRTCVDFCIKRCLKTLFIVAGPAVVLFLHVLVPLWVWSLCDGRMRWRIICKSSHAYLFMIILMFAGVNFLQSITVTKIQNLVKCFYLHRNKDNFLFGLMCGSRFNV
jgi:hypothetical protein